MPTDRGEKIVLVGGSRTYKDQQKVNDTLDNEAKDGPVFVLDGGYSKGAQKYAREWREKNNMRGRTYAPHWDKGKRAASDRNYQMVNYGAPDKIAAFHENYERSIDTRNMVNHANNSNKKVDFYKSQLKKPEAFDDSKSANKASGKTFAIGPRLQGIDLNTDDCVDWPGAMREGYGVKKMGSTTINAHRYVYEQSTGKKIPKGQTIDHKCRNRKCVNPKHLEAVTPSENKTRAWAASVSKSKPQNEDKLKRDAVVAGAAGVALAPRKYAMPYTDAHQKISGSTARVSDLRQVATGSGARIFDNQRTAKIASDMKQNGFRPDQPIEVTRFRDGTMKVTNGNHRLKAAQMAGVSEAPIRISDSSARTATTSSNFWSVRADRRRTEKARKPIKAMSARALKSKAGKKPPGVINAINNIKSASEGRSSKYVTGAAAAAGLGAYGYKRRDELKGLKNTLTEKTKFRTRESA